MAAKCTNRLRVFANCVLTISSTVVVSSAANGNKSDAGKTNSSDNEEKCLDSEKEEKESLTLKEALEKGWTSASAENLTIAQLYLTSIPET
jgi:hypothetical protein